MNKRSAEDSGRGSREEVLGGKGHGGGPVEDVGDPPEPRWAVIVAVVAAAGVYLALPDSLSVGPRWLAPGVVGVLLVPGVFAHHTGRHRVNQLLGYVTEGVMTLFMVWSLVLLVRALPGRREEPLMLIRSAAALWVSNVLVFSLWYWRLDAGGPYRREAKAGHDRGAFLFPQMTLHGPLAREADGRAWAPRYLDYLFLAFNTSTAFSPTDSPVLSRWAKVLTMTQAGISLTVVVILVGRAVNIL
jgi:hypothetical protein